MKLHLNLLALVGTAQYATQSCIGVSAADNQYQGDIHAQENQHLRGGGGGNRQLSQEWITITEDDFEGGLGSFQTIGRDGQRMSSKRWGKYAHGGRASVQLRDNSGAESSLFHKDVHDVTMYDRLRVTFWFFAVSMETGHDLLLEYSSNGGRSWRVVKKYERGGDNLSRGKFANNKFYKSTVLLNNDLDTTEAKLRIRCDASTNNDLVYIDDVTFEGLLKEGYEFPPPTSMPIDATTTTITTTSTTDTTTTAATTEAATTAATTTATTTATTAATTVATTETAPATTGPETPVVAAGICPLRRLDPPDVYQIQPFEGPSPYGRHVQNDLSEMSYIVFSDQLDPNGNPYAYTASDKAQFSLKVIQFTNNPIDGGFYRGEGNVVATYELAISRPTNDDWEDISLGPCTDSNTNSYSVGQTCIYVGNIGNNDRRGQSQRRVVSIFKFVEPTIGVNGPVSAVVQVAKIQFSYGSSFPRRLNDAEALFADWTGVDGLPNENKGDLYVATKSNCGGVGKIPVSFHKSLAPGQTSAEYSMTNVLGTSPPQLSLTCSDRHYKVWTGADMRRDGRLIAMVRTGAPPGIYFFPRYPGETVVQALGRPGCDYVSPTSAGLPDQKLFEAVAFVDAVGSRVVDLSECGGGQCKAPIFFHELVYSGTVVQPVVEPFSGWNRITLDTFEGNNWGNFRSGGRFALLRRESDTGGSDTCRGKCSCGGDWAARLNEDRGIPSSMAHRSNHDCRNYSQLRVTFSFKTRAYDHIDAFFLELSLNGGDDYHIIGSWANEVNGLSNAQCVSGHVVVQPDQFYVSTFGDAVRLRFRSSSSTDGDRVYIDNVEFEGHS